MNGTFSQLSAWNTFLNASDVMRELIVEDNVDEELIDAFGNAPNQRMVDAVLGRLLNTTPNTSPRLTTAQLRQVSVYVRHHYFPIEISMKLILKFRSVNFSMQCQWISYVL